MKKIKDKLIIDTNILYHYLDISKNPKLNNFNFDEYELYITSVSLIEAITHFKDDIEIIKQILKPIIDEKIILIGIGFLPISNNEINCLYHNKKNCFKNEEEIIKGLLKLKIEQEANFSRWFYTMIIEITFNMLIETYYFEDNEKNKKFQKVVNSIKKSNTRFIYEKLKENLEEGYKNNNASKEVKSFFYDLIGSTIRVFLIFYYEVEYNGSIINKNSMPSQEIQDTISLEFNSDKFIKAIDNKYLFRKDKDKNKGKNLINKRKHCDNYIDSIKKIIKDLNHKEVEDRLRSLGLRFLEAILNGMFIEGTILEKNDIEDFLIMQALNLEIDDKKYLFMSLDRPFLKLMKNTHPRSYEFYKNLNLN